MSNTIVPGTGDWSFGLAGMVYEPFILTLETMGYRRNHNLFICFYDWSQRIEHSSSHYLLKTIAQAKEKTGSNQVNIVCHSMGGLVSRAYVQSTTYKNDVDKLVILCTPNAGSPPNYSYWTGGELPLSTSGKFNFVHFYMKMYLTYLSKRYKSNKIEVIHTHFKGLQDIMPSVDYGNYLIMNNNGDRTFVDYFGMKSQNKWLDQLNANRDIIQNRNIDVTLIAGTEEETIKYLEVVSSQSIIQWADGKVIGGAYTNIGDGDAVLDSVFLLDGDQYTVEGTHIETLYKSESILRSKLRQ
ncbi:acetyltransferase [Alkalihalobacillus berkeleyi]|uniref:Acetyltransferase n=2 Tax=Pseudalkalibacillus berkeleyi TaxID=1069813 RepID=A0ABS9H2P3_9BACL|nr:acetyltransferase [Pseudalkalibacillus berkeleyi]